MMKGPLFYAKILLFGEYGIIKNAKALSIPYNYYKGALRMDGNTTEAAVSSNAKLKAFAEHLTTLDSALVTFDHKRLTSDLNKGMYFDSSIPQGYGVGSSGALVAAIYDRYAFEKITVLENLTRQKLTKLKDIFSAMESFFHGKSSGLDPLNSFLSLPILIHSKSKIEPTGIPSQSQKGKAAVFLLDSGMTSETAPLVSIFLDNLEAPAFRKMMKHEFIAISDRCIEHFLSGNISDLFSDVKKLSSVVLEHFSPMIPKRFRAVWKKGIDTNAYYLKLCGSGGGGYILGFTQDLPKAKSILADHQLEVVYTF
jgi:mevalonate kinase|tara:strand:+ start:1118 stop:2050 length:933 start_codon:yes stop_codon:yes gene_type:complete